MGQKVPQAQGYLESGEATRSKEWNFLWKFLGGGEVLLTSLCQTSSLSDNGRMNLFQITNFVFIYYRRYKKQKQKKTHKRTRRMSSFKVFKMCHLDWIIHDAPSPILYPFDSLSYISPPTTVGMQRTNT